MWCAVLRATFAPPRTAFATRGPDRFTALVATLPTRVLTFCFSFIYPRELTISLRLSIPDLSDLCHLFLHYPYSVIDTPTPVMYYISCFAQISRGRAVAARVAHNHKVAGSSPAPATSCKLQRRVNKHCWLSFYFSPYFLVRVLLGVLSTSTYGITRISYAIV